MCCRLPVWSSPVSLEHAILGLLDEHPRSGYDLKTRCFDEALSPFWTADQAQIYRTLDRLKDDRLVSVTTRKRPGRPERRIYQITRSGREVLDGWLSSPLPAPPLRDPFFLQLYFASPLQDEQLLSVLDDRRRQHQERLDELNGMAAELAESALSPRVALLRQTALDGAAERERALIVWLDDCITAIRDGVLPGTSEDAIGQRAASEAEPA